MKKSELRQIIREEIGRTPATGVLSREDAKKRDKAFKDMKHDIYKIYIKSLNIMKKKLEDDFLKVQLKYDMEKEEVVDSADEVYGTYGIEDNIYDFIFPFDKLK
jgi:hypothetical protein